LVAFLETRKRPLRPQDQAKDTASSSKTKSGDQGTAQRPDVAGY
jgi:hypothetical protein